MITTSATDRQSRTGRWINWGRNVIAQPSALVTARTSAEVQQAVLDARTAGHTIKTLGSGHSFSPIAATDGVALDVAGLRGIESIAPGPSGTTLVGFGGGTRLRAIGPALWRLGLAMPNMGDIDAQTISGALATGTHGTGSRFPGLTGQVAALTIVTADGTVVDCDPNTHPDLFAAARLGLGAIGVVTRVVLACVPAFLLEAVGGRDHLESTLETYHHDRTTNDHYEFFWFPHTDVVQTKRNRRIEGPVTRSEGPPARITRVVADTGADLFENSAFGILNRITTRLPSTIPAANRLSAAIASTPSHTVDRSYRAFVSPRRVHFREMEYAVPVERVPELLRELSGWLKRSGHLTTFPVEVRCAAADDVWLSTGFGRDTGYVAVHQYHRQGGADYFRSFEAMARALGGRPHWGKMHDCTAADLRASYPHFDDFRRVRDHYDPDRLFDNDYLRRVLG